MKIDGCTAVISGASRGIGLGIAKAFAQKGANIVLLGRNRDTLETAQGSLLRKHAEHRHEVYVMDVSKANDWAELFKTIEAPKFLVNVAGMNTSLPLPCLKCISFTVG